MDLRDVVGMTGCHTDWYDATCNLVAIRKGIIPASLICLMLEDVRI